MSYPHQQFLKFIMPNEQVRPYHAGMDVVPSTMATTFLRTYTMHREQWIFLESTANNVPSYQWNDAVVVDGYRCDNCKRFFIAADLLDFEHGCTEEDYKP